MAQAETADALIAKLDAAKSELESNPVSGIAQLREVLAADGTTTEVTKVKEGAISALTSALADQKDVPGLQALLKDLRPMHASMPKAKTARIVRQVIDAMARVPGTEALQIEICKEQVQWARSEKRTFLRQRIEMRLATLLIEIEEYKEALALVNTLLTEIKRLDDKLLLVDVHLIESRLHHLLRNTPKSKAALTAARTAAGSVYVPPSLQAEIDMQSGTLNAEERDFKTAYSYFFEAFEQLNNLKSAKALPSLKYMLLCKIMAGDWDDVGGIVTGKAGLRYGGPDVEAMQLVAKARSAASLTQLEAAVRDFRPQLEGDAIVKRHLADLFKALLEQNLVRLIKPYRVVDVAHLAAAIQLDSGTVERELSQLILDGKIAGILDQGTGCLEIFDTPPEERGYPAALKVIQNMGSVVDTLFARSQKLVS